MKNVDKTEVILDAAIRVFAEKGYYGARVSDIAKEAGIAYGLVYHYFKSKEDLMVSIFRTRWDEFISAIKRAIEEEEGPVQMIRKIISFLFHSYKNDPMMIEVMIMDVAKSSRSFTDESIRHFKEVFSLIAGVVKQGKEMGIFNQGLDETLTAYAIYGSVERIMLWWILDNRKAITDGEARGATEMLMNMLTDGLLISDANR